MSLRTTLILICLTAILAGLVVKTVRSRSDEKSLVIGILQTASHPALDETRENFIAEMKRLTDGNVAFAVQNAEGSISQARTIAEHFHAHERIQAIFAIGTPAVQAAARAEKTKPIFIAAVSEPEALGIDQSNLCGTSDRINTDAQAEFVQRLLPDVKSVFILYNPGEANSTAMVKRMKLSLLNRVIESSLLGVNGENEIAQAVLSGSRKADALLVPADNLLVGAMPLLAKEALKQNCPLIASDVPSVSKGALAAQGADYGDLGIQTALLAYQVLALGKTPLEIGIRDPENATIRLNQAALETLRIAVPEPIAEIAIGGGSL